MEIPQERRSKGACRTCKQRKKKCDEQKPICLRCQRGGLECGGYEPPQPRRKGTQLQTTTQSSDLVTFPSVPHTMPFNTGGVASGYGSLSSESIQDKLVQDEPRRSTPVDASHRVYANGTVTALAIEMRVCELSANAFWNNLLDVYSAWHTQSVLELPAAQAVVVDITRKRAVESAVLRNGMLSNASLFLLWTSNTSDDTWKNQAFAFNSSALSLLGEELRNPNVSTSRKFSGVAEVLMFEVAVRSCWASSTQQLLAEGASLLSASHEFGVVQLSELAALNQKTSEIAFFVMADIISSIFLSRPTLLHYVSAPPTPHSRSMSLTERIMSCSSSIAACMSRISHLRPLAFADLVLSGSLSEATLSAAQEIEHDIRSYQAPYSDTLSREALITLSAQECWRFAALIQLYQTVYLVGPLHPVIVDSLQQLIAASRLVPVRCAAERGLGTPYFLAGTVAISHKDRAYLGERLSRLSWLPEHRYMWIMEEVWARSDQTGQPVYWGLVAEEQVVAMS